MHDAILQAFDLTGRTAVVTGGASGIGEATAIVLAGAGANVVVGDLNLEGAEDTVAQIVAQGGTAVAQQVNVASKEQVDALVARGVSEYGAIHIMANVAGVPAEGHVLDITEEYFDRIMAINLKGTLFGCQAAARAMQEHENGGSIINVASASIDIAAPNYGMYAMTKAAVAQLTMTLTHEVGKHGIRVNTISPGATITPFTKQKALQEDGSYDQVKLDEFEKMMKWISPLRKIGEAQDQANLILFLASDASKWCTGQTWRANGGQAIVR